MVGPGALEYSVSSVSEEAEGKVDREAQKKAAEARRLDAKRLAEERRAAQRSRKRRCALCQTEESEKLLFVAHPDGIGPTCREPGVCEYYRAAALGKPLR